jgi:type II secretory ATPase GspE/PulE/Tfp pilus assembly ATPase PilB-like protein
MRKAIGAGTSELQIREMAKQAGGGSLLQSGTERVLQGITTAEEVIEATFTRDFDV